MIITQRDHSLFVCATYEYMCVILHAHPIHDTFNTTSTETLQQYLVSAWSLSYELALNLNEKSELETSTQNLIPEHL